MTKATIFIPVLDSIWRFRADWMPPEVFMRRGDNDETLWGEGRDNIQRWMKATGDTTHEPNHGTQWVARYHAWEKDQREARGTPAFLAGTVVVFDRYHISHSGDHCITLRILAAPDPLLLPKKQKGQMRGAGRIYLRVEELNTFPELEQVDDFQAG